MLSTSLRPFAAAVVLSALLSTSVFSAPETPRFIAVSTHESVKAILRDLSHVGITGLSSIPGEVSGLFLRARSQREEETRTAIH